MQYKVNCAETLDSSRSFTKAYTENKIEWV